MKRNTLLIVVVVIAGIFMLFNPLKSLLGNSDKVVRTAVDKDTTSALVRFAQGHWQSPEEYIVSVFGAHDIVFLGEFFKIRQNVLLVSGLIPRLYAAGVRNLGIEFALSDNQKDIDALVTGPAWDEVKARAISFNWLVTWGYQEYIDLYKAAWQLNKSLPAGAKRFRVVGLNVRQNWEYLKTQSDLNDQAVMAKILGNGIPDAHMAEVIDKELVQKGEKALIYCGTQRSFTRYHSVEYEKNAAAMKLSETRRTGNIIFAKIGAKAFTISLHAPWPDKTSMTGFAFPAEGAIDALIDLLPPAQRSAGWNTAGTPLGALPVRTGSYANGSSDMTLADLFDGYVIQGPIGEYTTVTPIADFIRPEDADRAARDFPGVKTPPLTAQQVSRFIEADLTSVAKTLSQFR